MPEQLFVGGGGGFANCSNSVITLEADVAGLNPSIMPNCSNLSRQRLGLLISFRSELRQF